MKKKVKKKKGKVSYESKKKLGIKQLRSLRSELNSIRTGGSIKKRKKSKKRSKKNTKNPVQARKDFEVYASGVQRLRELKGELSSLDARGFPREVQFIQARLKNVSDIPLIEKKMKELRSKIRGRYKPKRKKSVLRKEIGQIKEDMEDVHKIKRAVKKLGDRIEDLGKKKKEQIDVGVGVVVDTSFDNFLKDLKTSMSGRIRKKEKELDANLHADLRKREDLFHEKYKKLAQDFNRRKKKLKNKFESKYKQRVALGLEKDITEKFNSAVKRELNKEKGKVRKRYLSHLRAHAQSHLRSQEASLKKRFDKKISSKVAELESEFVKERDRLGEQEKKDKNSLVEEVSRKKRELNDEFNSKKRGILERLSDQLKKKELINNALEREKKRLESEIGLRERRLSRNKVKIQEKLKTEKSGINEKLKREKERLKLQYAELKNKEAILEHYQNMLKKKKEGLIRDNKSKLESEKKRLREMTIAEISKGVEKAVTIREREIRKQLRNEYDLKLKKKVQAREDELKKKKIALESQIQNQMKQLLK